MSATYFELFSSTNGNIKHMINEFNDTILKEENEQLKLRISYLEKELESAQDVQRQILNSLPLPIVYKNSDKRYIGGNILFETEIIGVSDAMYAGKTIDEIRASLDETQYKILNKIDEVVESLEFGSFQDVDIFNYIGNSCTYRIYKSTIQSTEANERMYSLAILIDITDQKNREKELHIEEYAYRRIYEDAAHGIFQSTLDGRFLRVNPAFVKIFGYDSEQDLLDTITDIATQLYFNPESRKIVLNQVMNAEGAINVETVVKRKDGSPFICNMHWWAIRDEHNNVQFLEGFIEDITEKKKTEAKLEGQRKLLDQLEKTAKIGAWELDLETQTQVWTDGVYDIHEVDKSFNPNLDSGISFYHKEDRETIYRAVETAVINQTMQEERLRFFTAKGTPIWVNAILNPKTENGVVKKLYGTIQDVTERVKIEKKIEAYAQELQETNREKDTLLSILGHDLKNPFHSILGMANGIRSSLPQLSDKQIDQYLGNIEGVAITTFSLLENLLLWSRSTNHALNFNPQIVKIKPILNKTLGFFNYEIEKKKIAVRMLADPETTVYGDPLMIETILRNLIHNSIKFSPYETPIEISSEMKMYSTYIIVRDYGKGMTQTEIDSIFANNVNLTLRDKKPEQGTGIGLELVKELLRLNKGALTIKSEMGKGSEFIISLPYKKKNSATE